MISGFQASDIGQYGIQDFSFWERGIELFGTIWDFGLGGQSPFEYDIFRPIPVPVVIGEVPQTWDELEQQMPELFEPILETRPGHVADSYPQDVEVAVTREQSDDGEDDMAIDWAAGINTVIDVLQGQSPGGNVGLAPPQARDAFLGPSTPSAQLATAAAVSGSCDGMTWGGGAPPKGYKVVRDSCGNGVLRKVRRRRRRRMLTQGDKSDIAAIVSMVGKGQLASSLINRSTS